MHNVQQSERDKYLKISGLLLKEIDTKDEELDRLLHKIETLSQTKADDECSVCFESVSRFVRHVRPIY